MKVEIEPQIKIAICIAVEESFILVFGETEQKGKEIAEIIKGVLEGKK